MMAPRNYCKHPVVPVPNGAGRCVSGWDAIERRLTTAIRERSARKTVVVVELYPGVNERQVAEALSTRLRPEKTVFAADALLPPEQIERLVSPFLGGNDPVFGFLSGLTLPEFFDSDRVQHIRKLIHKVSDGLVLVCGCGAQLLTTGDILVYADLARWEIQ